MQEQLTLFQTPTAATPTAPNVTAWESSPDGQTVLTKLREESRLWGDAAESLGLDCHSEPVARWSLSNIKAVRSHLEGLGAIAVATVNTQRTNAPALPPRPYRPLSEDRKQRSRCTKVLNSHRKRYTLGAMWMDFAQQDIARRPWYFGACSLPTEPPSIAPPYASQIVQRKAIAREIALRQQEIERYNTARRAG